MRWKWNWFKGCYYREFSEIYLMPLARGFAGIVIFNDGGHVVVAPFDERRSDRSVGSVNQSKFVELAKEPRRLTSEEAQPYVSMLREAVREARNRTLDVYKPRLRLTAGA